MTRVAIYARYSSDEKQRDTSIEDQVLLCRARAQAEGWDVVEVYADHGISGDTLILRPGVQALMRDAMAGKFNIVLSEALDRMSRDQEAIAGVYKRLQFFGLVLVTLTEGEINELHIGLKGTMNALFLKDLKDKTRRGQRGKVERGKSGGGLAYGYGVARTVDAEGEQVRGDRFIKEDEARIVRCIFEEYAKGTSPKKIAAMLNSDDIVSPSGKGWAQSTINGNRQRGTGILNNELYVGRIVWNRTRKVKDPDTGVRLSRPNPPEDWVIKEVPELRIIDDALWQKAKSRQRKLDRVGDAFWTKQRPVHLFSGLLKCGCCGGGFSKSSTHYYGCAAARNKGLTVCDNTRTVKQADLEHTILQTLKTRLMEPGHVDVFCEAYTRRLNALRHEHNASVDVLRVELGRLEAQERRIVKAVLEGFATSAMKAESLRVEERKAEIERLLSETPEERVFVHPQMSERYRQEVEGLVSALSDDDHRSEAIELIRSLIDRIVLTPVDDGEGYLVDVHGDLAGILNVSTGESPEAIQNELDLQQIRLIFGAGSDPAAHTSIKLAPRAGLEPATQRLTAACSTN